MSELDELLIKIEELRAEMIKVKGRWKSFHAPAVVAASQEVDDVLNQYYKLIMAESNVNNMDTLCWTLKALIPVQDIMLKVKVMVKINVIQLVLVDADIG